MARLPRRPVHQAQLPQNNIRVINNPRISDERPDLRALRQIGEVGTEFGMAIADEKYKQQAADADLNLQKDLDALYRELEADPNLRADDIEATYEARARELVETHRDHVQAPMYQKAYDSQAERLELNYLFKTRGLVRNRQVGEAKAGVLRMGDELAEMAADPTTDPDLLVNSTSKYKARVRSAGTLFTADQRAEMELAADDVLQKGRDIRFTDRIESALLAGDYTAAQEIYDAGSSDRDDANYVTAEARSAARTAIENGRIVGEAQTWVDEAIESGATDQELFAKLGDIDNVKVRDEATTRLVNGLRMRDAAILDTQEDIIMKYHEDLRLGRMTYRQIPEAEREQLSITQANALMALDESADGDVKTDRYAYTEFHQILLDDTEAAFAYLMNNSDKFGDTDFKSLVKALNAARKSDAEDAGKKPGPEGILGPTRAVDLAASEYGITSHNGKDELLRDMHNWHQLFEVEHGRPASDAELEDQAQRQARKIRFSGVGGSWIGDTVATRAFKSEDHGRLNRELEGRVPERHRSALVAAFAMDEAMSYDFVNTDGEIETKKIDAINIDTAVMYYDMAIASLAAEGYYSPGAVLVQERIVQHFMSDKYPGVLGSLGIE